MWSIPRLQAEMKEKPWFGDVSMAGAIMPRSMVKDVTNSMSGWLGKEVEMPRTDFLGDVVIVQRLRHWILNRVLSSCGSIPKMKRIWFVNRWIGVGLNDFEIHGQRMAGNWLWRNPDGWVWNQIEQQMQRTGKNHSWNCQWRGALRNVLSAWKGF